VNELLKKTLEQSLLAAAEHIKEQQSQLRLLVEALVKIESDDMPFIESFGRFAMPKEIAAAALKEVKGE